MYHLFALIVFPCATLAISCDSRFYCKTDEAKYVSMNQIPKTYLNATVLKKYTVKEMSACQQFCIRAEKCQSLNLNMSKTKEFECQILDANIYSNSSLLLTNDNFTHLFILVSTKQFCIHFHITLYMQINSEIVHQNCLN